MPSELESTRALACSDRPVCRTGRRLADRLAGIMGSLNIDSSERADGVGEGAGRRPRRRARSPLRRNAGGEAGPSSYCIFSSS